MSSPIERLSAALAERYRFERTLGAGGMATVYLAQDLRHHRRVAIKVLHDFLADDIGSELVLREIDIAARLSHPDVLPIYDSGAVGGQLYYVMAFVSGESLRQRLDRDSSMPIQEAVRILRDVAEALDHADHRGIVHRDVKPANIMLTETHALVADFGVAKALDAAQDERSETIGTAGIGTTADLLCQHLTAQAEPVTNHRKEIPTALAVLVMRCLEKNPADRVQHAAELLPALEASLAELVIIRNWVQQVEARLEGRR